MLTSSTASILAGTQTIAPASCSTDQRESIRRPSAPQPATCYPPSPTLKSHLSSASLPSSAFEHVLLPFPPSEARIFAAPPLLRVCRLIRSEAFDTAATILTNAITEARAERDVLNSRYPPGPIFCGVGMRASAIEDYRRLAKVKAWVRVLERLAWCLGFEVPEQGTEGHELSFPASSWDCE